VTPGSPRRLLIAAARIRQVQREQWLSPDELRDRQWRRCRAQLAHAFEHSPFYRRKLSSAGARPEDVRSWDDFARLPITRREELRDAEGILTVAGAGEGLHRTLTSGSTGRPTVAYFDADAWILAKYLLKLRARFACGMRPWDRVAFFQETEARPGFPRKLLRERTFSVHRPVEEIVPEVARFRPTVFYGFPSHLKLLALAAEGRLAPRLVFTSGELLDPATRRLLEQEYRAPVFDVYGCSETKEIAWQCPQRDGYHVNADWLVLESAGDGGDGEAPPDTLLVTSLYNSAMPLLRYAMGDAGVLRPDRCPCGRGLPSMEPSRGRTVDFFRLAGGARVAPYTLTCAIESVQGMRQYQIVQEAPDRVAVKVVPGPEFDDAARSDIADRLRPVLPGVHVEVRVAEAIPAEASGKYRIVRSESGAD
jgi:phenylacetate-CoA ligase